MGQNEQNKVKYNKYEDIMFALKDIREKYSAITNQDIELFAPIYYPIALLEMNLQEMTFEDLDTVQWAVLRLYSLGQVNHETIADLLGLSPNYIYRIRLLLKGYGLISEDNITDLGRQSILQGKKIIKTQVIQQFQADALTGSLIKLDRNIDQNVLNDKSDTKFVIGHIDYLQQIEVATINNQLKNSDYNEYIKQRGNILNANVLSIDDVTCIDIKYAKSYIIKLKDVKEPIIFAKRYNILKKELKERFSWQPFYVPNEMVRQRFGFESDIPTISPTAYQYIQDMFSLMLSYNHKIGASDIERALKKVYPFAMEGMEIQYHEQRQTEYKQGEQRQNEQSQNNQNLDAQAYSIIINVSDKAFTTYRKWILDFFLQIQNYGEYLITSDWLHGKVIKLRTNNSRIKEAAEFYSRNLTTMDQAQLVGKIKSDFFEIQTDSSEDTSLSIYEESNDRDIELYGY